MVVLSDQSGQEHARNDTVAQMAIVFQYDRDAVVIVEHVHDFQWDRLSKIW
jgi:hypothetical protein